MSPAEIEALLDRWGFTWKRGDLPSFWWVGCIGEKGQYTLRLHLGAQRVFIAFAVDGGQVPDSSEILSSLLLANEDLTVSKLALDDQSKLFLVASWPSSHLTEDNLGFMTYQLIDDIDRLHDLMATSVAGE